jgi:glucosamine--fructose-6-phosphate aminotransferase (isomerizing)
MRGDAAVDESGYGDRQQLTVPNTSERLSNAVDSLKRCSKCILPETMPFIQFDEHGVCNYCRNHRKVEVQGEAVLQEFLDKYRSKSGEPDCIVTFSGGRDSSYGLHYVKTVLKMNPVAYSYDWGMITDLGRRNQARMCGKLGIEHILVSADIKKKRRNIRRNIEAWFKNPALGTIPLFMAGDKQYFYYANKLRRETGIPLIILCECPFEKTDFKSGFCGIRPKHQEKSVYAIPALSKARLAQYYASQFIRNPAYLNRSVFDTVSAFFSYYLIPHDFLKLYDYVKWDEEEIAKTLISEYDWETANDTNSIWRIGDGTAPFYNYIYYVMAGFTENDTFRSNQIREGLIRRDEALALVRQENRLRSQSLKWYCDTVEIPFEDTIDKILALPKLYDRRP